MTTQTIAWSPGTWSTPPRSVRERGGQLLVEAVKGSDYWQKTLYVPECTGAEVTIRASRARDAVIIRASANGEAAASLRDAIAQRPFFFGSALAGLSTG